MAQETNLGPFYRGEDIEVDFTMTPLTDITAWTLAAGVKTKDTEAAFLVTPAMTIQTAASGTFKMVLSSTQSASLTGDRYRYNVWRTDSGSAALLAFGTLTMKGSVRIP